ncbi:MAG: peptidylprolyl isomerase [Saprospiraceae bacterium]
MIKKIILLATVIAILGSCGESVRKVQIQTEYGNMTFELYNSTPLHRDNFVKLISAGFYDDLLFHRVMNQFMIQGGDPESKNAPIDKILGTGGPGYTTGAEIGAPHFKGTLAAARTPDAMNPERRSSGSQFYIVHGRHFQAEEIKQMGQSKNIQYSEVQLAKYINVGGYPPLDMEYTVFGEITEGMDVIDKIAAVQTQSGDRPTKDVKMKVIMLN